MKSTSQRRLGTITLLALLALFVLAVAAQAAGAALVAQRSSGNMASGLQISDPVVGTQGGLTSGGQDANIPKAGVPAAPSASDSTTAWVAIVTSVAVAVAILSVWVTRRRRTLSAQASNSAFCANNPDDALCRAG